MRLSFNARIDRSTKSPVLRWQKGLAKDPRVRLSTMLDGAPNGLIDGGPRPSPLHNSICGYSLQTGLLGDQISELDPEHSLASPSHLMLGDPIFLAFRPARTNFSTPWDTLMTQPR